MLRRLKPAYWLYNLFKRGALAHNLAPYDKLGLKKTYFSPVSSADFAGLDERPILEDAPAVAVDHTDLYSGLSAADRASVDAFDDEGYCVLKGYLDGPTVDTINAEVARLMESGELGFTGERKLMFAIRKSAALSEVWSRPAWTQFLDALIGGDARLFQSINFLQGSQQRTHSDSIHMTTFPLGGLLGIWIALEDITADSGPLHYYPGSHKLPYFLNESYGNEGGLLTIGDKLYTAYEDMIAEKMAATDYDKKVLLARRGDVLIWHANLLHGGEPQTNPERTRKSMVLHYFDARRVCYHEITQRPALFA